MSRKWLRWCLRLALAAVALGLVWAVWPRLEDAGRWRRQASPGPLAPAHAFLETQCSTCHVTLHSVPAAQCIVCHASETALLQRQATAFHASVGACVDCHREHEGSAGLSRRMDHAVLARTGLRQLAVAADDSEAKQRHHVLLAWIGMRSDASSANPNLSAMESTLECSTCHTSKDRHQGQFGADCAQCHAVTQWTLPEFRHPPPSSRDCAQCHQAPPSHFMEHFRMVSMKVAGQENAEVRQCYLCHQTTSWNDIRGVGLYDHH